VTKEEKKPGIVHRSSHRCGPPFPLFLLCCRPSHSLLPCDLWSGCPYWFICEVRMASSLVHVRDWGQWTRSPFNFVSKQGSTMCRCTTTLHSHRLLKRDVGSRGPRRRNLCTSTPRLHPSNLTWVPASVFGPHLSSHVYL